MFRPLNTISLTDAVTDHPLSDQITDVQRKNEYDEESVATLYSEALLLLGEKKYFEAEIELEKLLTIFATRTSRKVHKLMFPVLLNLADCYVNLHKVEKALTTLNEACSLCPRNVTAWFKLGCLLINCRPIYMAISPLKEAVSICQGIHWMALSKLCQCLFVIGLYDGIEEHSSFRLGHTLLLEIVKTEKSILKYNRHFREQVALLNKNFFDPNVISECERMKRRHHKLMSACRTDVVEAFVPSSKLPIKGDSKISLSDLCYYLVKVFDETSSAPGSFLDSPLKVEKDIPTKEDVPSSSEGRLSQRQPPTSQQVTRHSRLSTLASIKVSEQASNETVAPLRTKLLKYVMLLRSMCDSYDSQSEAIYVFRRRSSVSASCLSGQENTVDMPKLCDYDPTEELQMLFEGNSSLREAIKHILDRMSELTLARLWEKEDAMAFCSLFLCFRKYTTLRPYNSLDDLWNISVCTTARVYLEALVDFLTVEDGQYLASIATPSLSVKLTDEIDCVTLPSLLCPSSRITGDNYQQKLDMIRHSLLLFRLSKASHDFHLMRMASSACRSVLDDLPSFQSLFLGHVFRHPVWQRDEILMEMKWTQCYEKLKSMSDVFEAKNWEAICLQTADEQHADIFDASNFDLVISSDLAHYSVIYVEALFRCSKEIATDTLIVLLSSLLDTAIKGRHAPTLKRLLSEAWILCYSNIDVVLAPANQNAAIKQILSAAETTFNWKADSNHFSPFYDCSGLVCSLYAAFNKLATASRTLPSHEHDLAIFDSSGIVGLDESSASSFDSDEDSDFAKLPPGVKFLFLFHDLLAMSGCCRDENGAYLEVIRDRLVEFLQSPAAFDEGMTKAARALVEKQIDQCVHCRFAVTLRRIRSKSTQVIEHASASSKMIQPAPLTWSSGVKLFLYYSPRDLPAYDSFKGDSISADLSNFLRQLLALSPAKPVLSADELNSYLQGFFSEGAEVFLSKIVDAVANANANTDSSYSTDRQHCASICYLLADHVLKNADYSMAIKEYKMAIRFQPTLFDAWAGLALSWQSSLSNDLDDFDTTAKYWDPELLQPVVRGFQLALALEPNNGKLLMEYASFVFDIYSLLGRIERNSQRRGQSKSSKTNSLAERIVASFGSSKTRPVSSQTELLELAFDTFSRANASIDIDPPSDRWFCLYMLGKTGDKLGHDIVTLAENYAQGLELLFSHNAAFPGRTITSQNAPIHVVECFELFYRLHADILKFLASNEFAVLNKAASQSDDHILKDSVDVKNCLATVSDKVDKLSKIVQKIYSQRFASISVFAEYCSESTSNKGDEGGKEDHFTAAAAGREENAKERAILNLYSSAKDVNLVVTRAKELATVCIHALAFCSVRFPEHFKSRYRMTVAFLEHPLIANHLMCGHILLGWPFPDNENKGSFAGVKFGSSLFDPRKIQSGSSGSMLTGFWRSHHPDIDRRGTFFSHTEKCVRLLLKFLRSCTSQDTWKLIYSTYQQLARTASSSKRYLREKDQADLALKSLELAVEMLSSSLTVDTPCSKEKLLDVFRLHQQVVRGGFASLIERTTCLLVACFCSSSLVTDSKSDEEQFSPPNVAEVEKLCQNLIIQEKQQQRAANKRAGNNNNNTNTSASAEGPDREIIEGLLRSLVDRIVTDSTITDLESQ